MAEQLQRDLQIGLQQKAAADEFVERFRAGDINRRAAMLEAVMQPSGVELVEMARVHFLRLSPEAREHLVRTTMRTSASSAS